MGGVTPKILDSINSKAKYVSDYFSKDASAHPPRFVYHYTSLSALRDMLSAHGPSGNEPSFGKVWHATSVFQTNDPEESRALVRVLVRALKKTDFAQRVSMEAVEELSHIVIEASQETIVCFSEKIDDLAQWSHYGDNGRGVCLRIPTERILACTDDKHLGLSFDRALYADPSMEDRLATFLIDPTHAALISTVPDASVDIHEQQEHAHKTAVYGLLLSLSPFTKSADFANELEWRIVHRPMLSKPDHENYHHAPGLKLSADANSLKFFRKLVLSTCLIDQITIGPKIASTEAIRAINLMLRETNLSDKVDVVPSAYWRQ